MTGLAEGTPPQIQFYTSETRTNTIRLLRTYKGVGYAMLVEDFDVQVVGCAVYVVYSVV